MADNGQQVKVKANQRLATLLTMKEGNKLFMSDHSKLEQLFQEHDLNDFRWIIPSELVVSHWVRFKCMWGCNNFNVRANCPPNTPPVEDCRKFIDGYSTATIFHFAKSVSNTEERFKWTKGINESLLKLERSVFLSGYYKAFALYVDACRSCQECAGTRDKCKDKKSSRPAPDSLAIDVFQAVRKVGFPISVLTDPLQIMNRYGFILIE
jgi:predicted metal-binding protein